MELEKLKKTYLELTKKYKLPSFKEINEDFEIDKIDRECDTLLRLIRKTMMEKIVNSIGFFEMFLNPMNVPRLYFPYIKSMGAEDKKSIEEMYNVLSELSLLSLDLEVEYNEKKEAELIFKVHKDWNSIKPKFMKIIENIKKPVNSIKKEKTYYG